MDVGRLERQLEGKRAGDGTRGPMYPYATEMVGTYYRKVPVAGKDVLCVSASGDTVINAHALGAKHVTGFDINRFSKHITTLKWHAVHALSYAEFTRFFGYQKAVPTMHYASYRKVRPALDAYTRDFFDKVYAHYKNDGKRLARSPFFHQRNWLTTAPRERNAFLKNAKAYRKARNTIEGKKPVFMQADLLDIGKKLEGKRFDVINLSNVPTYLTGGMRRTEGIGWQEGWKRMYAKAVLPLAKRLKPQGALFFYLYGKQNYPNEIVRQVPSFFTDGTIPWLLGQKEFRSKEMRFKGVGKGQDRLIVMQKR